MDGAFVIPLIDAAAREATLFAAIWFLVGGLDDLAVDLLYLARLARAWLLGLLGRRKPLGLAGPVPPGRIAIFVPAWDEAAVIGRPHDIKGQAIAAFVTIKAGIEQTDGLKDEVKQHVAKKIGKIARPASIVFTDELPKTRSGKIMRRLLRDVSEQRQLGDVTSLANADVVRDIAERAKSAVTQED